MANEATNAADVLAKVAQIVALSIGAGWALWNYRLNRTHVPRLELSVNAFLHDLGGYCRLLISTSAKNPSLRSVKVRIDDSVVLVSKLSLPAGVLEPQKSEWEVPEVVYPFKWNVSGAPERTETLAIEPGLTISHEQVHLLPKPDPTAIFLLVFWVPEAPPERWWRMTESQKLRARLRSRKWRATRIITPIAVPLCQGSKYQ
jgi:hypothetical protein